MKKLLWLLGGALATLLLVAGVMVFLASRVPAAPAPGDAIPPTLDRPAPTSGPAAAPTPASGDPSDPEAGDPEPATADLEQPRAATRERNAAPSPDDRGSAGAADDATTAPAAGRRTSSERRADRAMVDTLAALLGLDEQTAETSYKLLHEVVVNGETEVADHELAAIITAAMASAPDGSVVLRATEPVRVTYAGDRVEIGTVVDLQALDVEALSAEGRDLVARVKQYAPFLAERPVWVAVSSAPFARNGDIDLGSNVAFQLGSLTLPGLAVRAMGLQDDLEESLLLDLRFLTVQQVEVRDQHLYLRAMPALAAR